MGGQDNHGHHAGDEQHLHREEPHHRLPPPHGHAGGAEEKDDRVQDQVEVTGYDYEI